MSSTSLLAYNSFHIEATAKSIFHLNALDDLFDFKKKYPEESVRIIGGGSNILLTGDIQEVVLINSIKGVEILSASGSDVLVKFMSGEVWHDCVLWAIENKLGGIENLSLIPGTIGAAPMQNIGAYGVELKDVFHSLEAVDLNSLEVYHFDAHDCKFGYRESIFKQVSHKGKYFIASVTLLLSKVHSLKTSYGTIQDELLKMGIQSPSIRDVSNAVIAIRKSKLPDPAEIGNAGSFFKNPVVPKEVFEPIQIRYPNMPYYLQGDGVKIPAAWLIETLKWKGYRKGDYGVHSKQALVLVNYNKASGQDILDLSTTIITSVKQEFNIELEREVNIW